MTKSLLPSFLRNPSLKKGFLLVSFVGAILVLRSNDSSPTGFLSRTVQRFLQEESIQEALCGSTSMSEISQGEVNSAQGIKDHLSSFREGNPLIEFIEGTSSKDEFGKEYLVPIVKFAAPWIAFFAISFLGCLLCLLNCLCMNTSCCRRCTICKNPKDERFKKGFGLCGSTFLTLLVGAAIAGFVFSNDVWNGGKQSVCAIGVLMGTLIDGSANTNDHWVGVEPLITRMASAFDNYVPATFVTLAAQYTAVTATTDNTAITTAYTPVSNDISTFETNNQGKTVARANPSVGGTYTPSYIQDISNKAGLMSGEIYGKRASVTTATNNISAALPILGGGSILTLAIQDEINTQLADANSSIGGFSGETKTAGHDGRKGVDGIFGGLIAVFAVNTLIGLSAGTFIVCLLKGREKLKKCLNLCWFILAIFVLFSWVLSALLFPTGIVLVEACGTINKFTTDAVFYNQTFDKFWSQGSYKTSRNIMYSCLFGDGQVLEVLDIEKYFSEFEPLLYGLDATEPFTATSSFTVVDSVQIPAQQAEVTNYQDGTFIDAIPTLIDLLTLNTMTQDNSCTSIRDTWTLNSDLCTNDDGTKFTSSSNENFNLNSPTCIGFDAWGSKTSTSRYSSSDVSGCSSSFSYSELTNFVTQFATSRSASETVFTNANTDLSTIATSNANFMTKIKDAANNLQVVRTGADPVYQSLGHPTKGILRNSNCKWVIESLGDLENRICVRFIPGLFKTTVVIIITSFLGMFASFAIFCFSKRIRNGKDNKVTKGA